MSLLPVKHPIPQRRAIYNRLSPWGNPAAFEEGKIEFNLDSEAPYEIMIDFEGMDVPLPFRKKLYDFETEYNKILKQHGERFDDTWDSNPDPGDTKNIITIRRMKQFALQLSTLKTFMPTLAYLYRLFRGKGDTRNTPVQIEFNPQGFLIAPTIFRPAITASTGQQHPPVNGKNASNVKEQPEVTDPLLKTIDLVLSSSEIIVPEESVSDEFWDQILSQPVKAIQIFREKAFNSFKADEHTMSVNFAEIAVQVSRFRLEGHPYVEADALLQQFSPLQRLNNIDRLKECFDRLIYLFETHELPDALFARFLNHCANSRIDVGDVETGRKLLIRSLAIYESLVKWPKSCDTLEIMIELLYTRRRLDHANVGDDTDFANSNVRLIDGCGRFLDLGHRTGAGNACFSIVKGMITKKKFKEALEYALEHDEMLQKGSALTRVECMTAVALCMRKVNLKYVKFMGEDQIDSHGLAAKALSEFRKFQMVPVSEWAGTTNLARPDNLMTEKEVEDGGGRLQGRRKSFYGKAKFIQKIRPVIEKYCCR